MSGIILNGIAVRSPTGRSVALARKEKSKNKLGEFIVIGIECNTSTNFS